ncbi:MAG: glycosyltransferase family 4 protein [Rhodocyclaceae bacterium]|nr:MAG: glycosyltransferase family 4 protein [Rhodocyclaceae bacterium]
MRVLMLSDVYFPRINGVSTSIETFRRDLHHHGVDVTLIAPDYQLEDSVENIHRVPARKLPFDPEDRLMHWDKLRTTAHGLAHKQFDVVHIQTPFAAHYAGVRFARKHGLPVLTTYHTHFEEYFHHYLPVVPRPLLKATARGIARGQCNGLNAIIVPSRAMRDTLRGYGVHAPLHVLPTGIPVERFRGGDGAAFRAKHGIAAERQVGLYVGRVAHEKNIGFLLEATLHMRALNPNFLLVVAGEGPALNGLRQQAKQLGIEDQVRFIGYLDRETELPGCYAAADVFVFASKTETQGLVLLEAMAAGVPAYAFAEMGTKDILEPLRGAVIAPQDAPGFAAGLHALLQDKPRLQTLSQEALAWADEWSAPQRAKQLAELYASLKLDHQP